MSGTNMVSSITPADNFVANERVPNTSIGKCGLPQRLQDNGRFAGRVAHDFDNILMGVMGFAELTQPLLAPNSPAAQYVGELLRVAQRGLEATRQMHQYSRSGQASPQPTLLQNIWGADELLRPTELPAGIRVDVTMPPDLPPVAIGTEPLRNVLEPLVRNAAEAMPADGTVTINARQVHLVELPTSVLPAELRPGSYVELTVADSGTGFRADVLVRLTTELFVTTKVRHRGLGLVIVFRILHAHGGGLKVESKPGGSTIRVYLPVVEQTKSPPCDMHK